MLDGLDEIEWDGLQHAYGPADDVPDLMRGLASNDPKVRSESLYELFGNIWHQGTVYEASGAAVPFLIELAAADAVADRDQILGLLHALAMGHSRKWAGVTRSAVARGVDLYLRLLADPNPSLRVAAAHTLSALREQRDALGSALRDAALREPDADARAGMLLSVALLGDVTREARGLFEGRFAAPADEREQFFAAVCLVAAMGADAPPAAAEVLARAAVRPGWVEDCARSLPWDAQPDVLPEEWLAKAGPGGAARALPVLVDGLRATADPVDASCIVDALLAVAFPSDKRLARDAPLTATQRTAVRSIADSDVAWRSPNLIVGGLELHGLIPRRGLAEAAEQRQVIRRMLAEQGSNHE